jgi:COP9 signalosome complex subunit 4
MAPLTPDDVASTLLDLEDASASKKPDLYNSLLSNILSNSSPTTLTPNLTAYIESLLSESLNVVTARPLLALFVEKLSTVPDSTVKIEVGKRAIDLLAPKVVSYEEQDTNLKYLVADAYEAEEEYVSSAQTLEKIPVESSQRGISADDKAKLWIRIVRCYVEEDDTTSALTYLNRIKGVIYLVKDKETRLHFNLNQAKILDSQRSFLDASAAYHSISLETLIDESERLRALSEAMKCAVLAPAGPLRGRTLAKLYKDDRATQVDEYGILEKIFLNRLLSQAEVAAFASTLQPHQLAKTADGSTVLDKAVLEHNLLAVSRLYSNISTESLGLLLGVDREKSEQYAAQMIEQGRLSGYIDQIGGFIYFEGGEGTGERRTKVEGAVVGREVRKWDGNVQGLAEEVERVAGVIQAADPIFYARHMVV